MTSLPKELKNHQYKKWRGRIFINTHNGDIVKLEKLVTRNRTWRKGLHFYFNIIVRGKSTGYFFPYYNISWTRNENCLNSLKEIDEKEISSLKDDLNTLFS